LSYLETRLAEICADRKQLKTAPAWHELAQPDFVAARFWGRVDIRQSEAECWNWNGAVHGNGYGNFRVPGLGRKNIQAHRMAFLLSNAILPGPQLVVRHKCDNPICCNPSHLEVGTSMDNARDKVERGRHRNRFTGPMEDDTLRF